MPNRNPNTGIRYGVIALNSLHPDTAHELMYGPQAYDLTHNAALIDLARELVKEADQIEQEAIEQAQANSVRHQDAAVERAYKAKNAADREDWIERELETRPEHWQIEEPTIEGTHEAVSYRIDWLGGSPMLWVFQSPHTGHFAPCSPCVPGAGDLNTPAPDGQLAYTTPADWLATE